MSLYDDIQATLRTVVGGNDYSLGRTVEFRRLTSKASVNPRVYSDWEESTGLTTDFRHQEEFDSDRDNWYRITTGRLRCPDDAPYPRLQQGDQVRFLDVDATTQRYFAVTGIYASGPGTNGYTLSNDMALMQDSDRKGGV